MKRLFLIIVFPFLLQCQKAEDIAYSHYNLEVNLKPVEKYLSVSLQLNYIHPFEPTDSLSFLLYEQMTITSIESKAIDQFVFDTAGVCPYRYTPSAGVLKIKLKKIIHKNENVDLRIKYHGQIGTVNYWQTNRLTEEWVELGNYTPWFPYNPDLETISFKIDGVIDDGYMVESNGAIDTISNHWIVKNANANNDMILCTSRNFTSGKISNKNYTLKFTSAVPFSNSAIDSILVTGDRILKNFSRWFGDIDLSTTKILVTPRETGGGYARKGMIVLSKINEEDYFKNKSGYIQYFSHEFSHFWWTNAPTDSWEDWLNEAFAEYSAMLSVRDIIGESEFEKRIQNKSLNIDSLPPIRGLNRDDQKAYEVLYNKGCYLLYTLEKEIGEKQFMAFLRSVYMNKISRTEDLIKLIADKFGQETAQQFNSKLDK